MRSVAERGTGWWRVTTDHVELATDVERSRAITAGWAFEDLYRALEHVFPHCEAPPITERVSVTSSRRPPSTRQDTIGDAPPSRRPRLLRHSDACITAQGAPPEESR